MGKRSTYTGENNKFVRFFEKILITRDDGTPYMYRNTLVSFGKWFSIKLHRLVANDDPCDHDHPWGFLTIILRGGYYEWTPMEQKERGEVIRISTGSDGIFEGKRWHGPGSILYRPATWRHRLQLLEEGEGNFIPATTLVFTGRVMRRWGFFTRLGWLHWKDYNKQEHC